MRVVAGVAGLFLLSGTALVAQSTSPRTTTIPDSVGVSCMEKLQPDDGKHAKGSTVTSCAITPAPGCPVDMRVRQQAGGATVEVDANGVKRKVFAQKLRLSLNRFRADDAGRKAVWAMVTVHGTGTKARMQSLDSGSAGDSMVRPFKVDLDHQEEPGVWGDFLLPGFTSASRVYLESVTYDDGSTWKFSRNEGCRVAVDPMMLINQ